MVEDALSPVGGQLILRPAPQLLTCDSSAITIDTEILPAMLVELDVESGDGGPEWSALIAGDCVIDRAKAGELLAPGLREQVSDANLAIANLEAPVPFDTEPIHKSGPALTTAPDSADRLASSGFDLLTLANNHIMDYGEAGLIATEDACAAVDLLTCGAGSCRSDALDPARVDRCGIEIAVVNVCEREYGVASRTEPGTAPSDHRDAVSTIRTASYRADTVIVVSHGGVEYVPLPPPTRRERLREFVEAGADVVVGHHPHVVQGWEVYRGVPIFPSIGNFAFDRQADTENTARGLVLDLQFQGSELTAIEPVPTRLNDRVESLPEGIDTGFSNYLTQASEVLASDKLYDAHWQTIADRLFHERYSNWLLTGVGETLGLARANPTDPAAQRPRWDPERRRTELLTLLNVVRNESHNDVVSTALALLSGAETDRRTDEVAQTTEDMMAWTVR